MQSQCCESGEYQPGGTQKDRGGQEESCCSVKLVAFTQYEVWDYFSVDIL